MASLRKPRRSSSCHISRPKDAARDWVWRLWAASSRIIAALSGWKKTFPSVRVLLWSCRLRRRCASKPRPWFRLSRLLPPSVASYNISQHDAPPEALLHLNFLITRFELGVQQRAAFRSVELLGGSTARRRNRCVD